MDGSFVIFIPQDHDLSPFEFDVPMFEWQGVNYPQGPPECKFGVNFILKMTEENDVPQQFKINKWLPIEVLDNGIDIFIESLYGFAKEEIGYTLKDLITTLLNNKTNWIVIYSHQHDGYSKIVNCNIEDILLNFEHALKASEGILIYK